MLKKTCILLHFNIHLSDINDVSFIDFVHDKCSHELCSKVYDGLYIKDIISIDFFEKKKINIDGTIHVKIKCFCNTIDPILQSVYPITINDVNKMGYSYKFEHLCIFIPLHLCDKITLHLGDTVDCKIIGKRIEENIVCIAQPV